MGQEVMGEERDRQKDGEEMKRGVWRVGERRRREGGIPSSS